MSGWELARAIRERDGAVPLAVITVWEAVGSLEQKTAAVDWVGGETFHYGTDSQDRRGDLSTPDENCPELLSAAAA